MKRKCAYENVRPVSTCTQETVKGVEDNLLLGNYHIITRQGIYHIVLYMTPVMGLLLSSFVVVLLFFFFFGFSFFLPSLLNFQARLFLTLYIFVKPKVNRPVGSLDYFYGWKKN